MQLFLVSLLTAAILVVLPIIGSSMRAMDETAQTPRLTVVHKNQNSPTLEELGQKAGDPAQAGVPESAPQHGSRRMEQWI